MRRQLKSIIDRTNSINPKSILVVSTVRNEMVRLPYFLEHHRKLGVGHFLFVDNDSDDGTLEFLQKQSDVSLWSTKSGYKQSRFGIDWVTWLQRKYAHGHWCLTLDADELFIYSDWEQRNLAELTDWLDDKGAASMACLMLDMYPKGPLSSISYKAGSDPSEVLNWFDCHNYTWERQSKFRNISIRGGMRKRKFFAENPEFAPHLHKTPLIKWHRSYAYVSSTHIALPYKLNNGFDVRNNLPTGVLLHSKFLDVVLDKSREEKSRREHFTYTDRYDEYYDRIIADPDLSGESSVCYEGWQQLEDLGLITGGQWS
jgi:glycosyltransferase involved in cell wall biosynthesis